MRSRYLIFGFCLLFAPLAHAQDNTAAPTESPPAATRIEADQKAHVIRFYIDGQEQAVLDAGGLHVRGNIDYSGALTDGNQYSVPENHGGGDEK